MGEGLRFGGRAVESVRVDLSAKLPVESVFVASLCRLDEGLSKIAPRVAFVTKTRPEDVEGARVVGPIELDGVEWWAATVDLPTAAQVIGWRPIAEVGVVSSPLARVVVVLEDGEAGGVEATVSRALLKLDPEAAERWRTPQPVGG